MELINNTTKTLRDDLAVEIKQGSRLSVAAACFSIYAFQELKKELQGIDELRFIFTSPTFTTEKAKKEKREFYIPRLSRERSLYGTEFEVKLRNELTQKAIAKECAEWIRKKVTFKSNVTNENMRWASSTLMIKTICRLTALQRLIWDASVVTTHTTWFKRQKYHSQLHI